MSIDDPCLEWLQDHVYKAFSLSEPECFEELLNRNDGLQELIVLCFLNDTHVEDCLSVLVFRSSRTEPPWIKAN